MNERVTEDGRTHRRPPRNRSVERPTPTWRHIYNQLRERIVTLDLQPGETLNEKEIAEEYGVSRTPVREATLRLADEGLIEVFPQSGTFIARIPYDELPEAMVIREALETKSVQLATDAATRSDIMVLRTIVERQREADLAQDQAAFHAADESFHAEIARIAGHEGLWKLVLSVKLQVDRYRRTTLFQPNRMKKVIEDHEAIIEGMTSGDPSQAVEALIRHLNNVLPDELPSKT
ncbi:GntR family transcriptional regulator [Pelagovum pacificum]|uniref:GntR family transcriptional regulator n=1 Tax=Pelagovum pacificum TaxID=2588711 RepID=A0A5C5GJZ2_9RHOB|nr:GntR family transcriptional regulator [Pelagovum pacificum]QQA42708.1 GntR family transcriptional regulator [Pelagovum pacificum]TNY34141.1 GntR family transcriptional regulator [Pelagovum pacificum]